MCFLLHGDSTQAQGISKQTHQKVYSTYVRQLVDYIYDNEVEQRNVKDIYFK